MLCITAFPHRDNGVVHARCTNFSFGPPLNVKTKECSRNKEGPSLARARSLRRSIIVIISYYPEMKGRSRHRPKIKYNALCCATAAVRSIERSRASSEGHLGDHRTELKAPLKLLQESEFVWGFHMYDVHIISELFVPSPSPSAKFMLSFLNFTAFLNPLPLSVQTSYMEAPLAVYCIKDRNSGCTTDSDGRARPPPPSRPPGRPRPASDSVSELGSRKF